MSGIPGLDSGLDAREPDITEPEGDEVARASLRTLLVRGFSWTFVENLFSQGLRFVSNLILTRLLFPEYFGLMMLVGVFIQGLEMISDVGIGLSVVQDKRGNEPKFLNTAWTIQALRGLVVYLAALLLTWPVGHFYGKPELYYLLPVAALGTVISGLNSINFHLLSRRVALGRITVLNISSQVLTIGITVVVAWMLRSVWALVIGSLAGYAIKCALSFLLCPGPPNRFGWDREIAASLVRFGKWIMVSSLLGFVSSRIDAFTLGAYLSSTVFGVYTIASNLSIVGIGILNNLASRVLFPIYARLAEKGEEHLRKRTFRVRAILMLISVPPYCVLAVFGQQVIDLLYPEAYADAGRMLRILAFGAIGTSVSSTIGPVLLAVGDSFRFMMVLVSKTLVLVASMALGNYYYGTTGAIVGFAVSDYVMYPILAFSVRKYGVWLPALDLAGFAMGIVCMALGYYWLP
ncbi:MAG: lipopolysaccharide biosynthesis protein [Candidatus Hydrogenedentes bacterium]|nr:lipopolysaccharide biosynthesis protein [Candidatus Hydrogenedentota bacterium]